MGKCVVRKPLEHSNQGPEQCKNWCSNWDNLSSPTDQKNCHVWWGGRVGQKVV